MTKVFRIENEAGTGPFQDDRVWNAEIELEGTYWLVSDLMCGGAGAGQDFGWEFNFEGWSFGCLSLEDLALWFPKYLQDFLEGFGYTVKEYQTETYLEGKSQTQVIFKK